MEWRGCYLLLAAPPTVADQIYLQLKGYPKQACPWAGEAGSKMGFQGWKPTKRGIAQEKTNLLPKRKSLIK
jgi:hypothetical protein